MGARVTRAFIDPDERRALDFFDRAGLSPSRWSNRPGDTYAAHQHAYHKVLFCLKGSITFHLVQTGEDVILEPGDRLDIEPNTMHSAVVGSQGTTCIEAASS